MSSPLGEKVRLLPALETCETTWESDGLEQTAGEILGILAKDASLAWGWVPELDEDSRLENPRSIWLVNLP